MEFRRTIKQDIERVMEIIKDAQEYLKESGINQWQNGYPNVNSIEEDISNGFSYVLVDDKRIVGTVAICFGGEITYEKIYDGSWLTDGDFVTVHRIAIDLNLKGIGLATKMFDNIRELCLSKNIHSIRIDTHMENKSMQNSLKKNGFEYCGIIYLLDGSKRVAFEKVFD